MKRSTLGDSEAVESLRKAINSTIPFEPHLRRDEPDWGKWVEPLGLPAASSRELVLALRRLWLLPFADVRAVTDLLVFQYTELPAIRSRLAEQADDEGERLCALFDLMVSMTLQGFSVFPQNPAHLARQIQEALQFPGRSRAHLAPILDLLIDPDTRQPNTGLNSASVADPDFIVLCEHERREGLTEGAWKAPIKYTEIQDRVREDPGFQADWRTIKRRFAVDRFRDGQGIIRRSKLEEGNWRQPIFSDLTREQGNFQVVFDFFCWKWFLYGMSGDEPLLQKLAYTLNPYGTMIFIPGYWSFDPKRDLNWDKILRLHRARGVGRQGPKLALGRQQKSAQLRKLRQADETGKKMKLKGQDRYSFLKEESGLAQQTDDAQVRRMLREARRRTA